MAFKLGIIVFALLCFTALKTSILLEEQGCVSVEENVNNPNCLQLPPTEFPNFDIPFEAEWDPPFRTNGTGLNAISDSIINVALVVAEIGEFVVAAVKWLFLQLVNSFKLSVMLIQWSLFLFSILFYTIPGAPWFINLILVTFPIIVIFMMLGLIRGTPSE